MQCRLSSYAEDVWDTFWFEKNLQGDIVAVYNTSGVKCISYTYDAWGKSRVTVNNASGTNARAGKNPFRYRGYYYDSDLELYYLNSRYYDATLCRFINVDSSLYHSMFGYNMYLYCNNNPVNYYDPSGESSVSILKFLPDIIAIAFADPTPAIEIAIVVIAVVIIIAKAVDNSTTTDLTSTETTEPPQSVTETMEETCSDSTVDEIKDKEEVDPYRRAGQKKQGGELKNKARRDEKFKDQSNKRHGRDKPKKHTPGRDHRKFSTEEPIKIF